MILKGVFVGASGASAITFRMALFNFYPVAQGLCASVPTLLYHRNKDTLGRGVQESTL